MKKRHFHYIFPAIVILAGIILILCGMNFYRALYLIFFGVFSIPVNFTDLRNEETPKGVKFWARKVLVNVMALTITLSLCNFLTKNYTDGFRGVLVWLSTCIICGILFGTFDYFAHNTGCDEAEFEAKKKQREELGQLYDRVVEEMNSEKE